MLLSRSPSIHFLYSRFIRELRLKQQPWCCCEFLSEPISVVLHGRSIVYSRLLVSCMWWAGLVCPFSRACMCNAYKTLLAAVTAHATESLGTRLVSSTHKIALCPTLWCVSVHDLYAAVSNTKQQPKELYNLGGCQIREHHTFNLHTSHGVLLKSKFGSIVLSLIL